MGKPCCVQQLPCGDALKFEEYLDTCAVKGGTSMAELRFPGIIIGVKFTEVDACLIEAVQTAKARTKKLKLKSGSKCVFSYRSTFFSSWYKNDPDQVSKQI